MSSITQTEPEQNQKTRILNAYALEGWKLLRLSKGDKNPVDTAWQKNTLSLEAAEAWLSEGGSIGLQMGEVSNWLCVVDLDAPEAQWLAPKFLPDTLKAGKEHEQLPSHYAYRSEGAGYAQVKGVVRKELLSLKASNNGKGHQVAVEPSVHSGKGPYRWHGGFNASRITNIAPDELRRAVGRLGAASLVAESLPAGGRHDYAMCLAGFLIRNGEPAPDVLAILKAAWEVKGALSQDADRDLEGIVRDTEAKIRNNEPAKGGRRLNEEVPHLPQRLASALAWERAEMAEGRQSYPRADAGNAERFVDSYGEFVRFCYPWKCWLVWDGARWARDDAGAIIKMARSTGRRIHEDAAHEPDESRQREISKWAIQSQNETRINAMLNLARPDVAIKPEALDADPWLLTVENGTIDLRSGELREHRPEDLITKLAPVEYHGLTINAPRFLQFLDETLKDEDLKGFVRRFAGYTLTGSTEERVFAILHGAGKNGKSTLVELMQDVLGDYAKNTDTETILQKRYSGVGNDVAALKGARFVAAAEVEQGRRLAEAKVKQLTGSDTVTARFLFGEPFDFRPQFKLWLSTNNKPEVKGTDNAIWDRIRLIPFTERFEGDRQDARLPQKLREEASGVLAWMVFGCLEWQAEGLGTAEAVEGATQEYREEMDTLAAFLEDRCVVHPGAQAAASNLYTAYKIWSEQAGEKVETRKWFGSKLKDRGFENFKISRGPKKGHSGWAGIGLQGEDPPDSDDDWKDV